MSQTPEPTPPTFQDRLIDKLRGRLGDLELELSSTALRLDLVAAERDYCVQMLAQHGLATQDADGNIKIGPPEASEVVPPEDITVLHDGAAVTAAAYDGAAVED